MNTSEIMSAMIFGDGGASKVEELSTDGGSTDAGKVLVVGDNGKIAASDLTVGEGEVAIDKTLKVTGAAADSKTVGDAIDSLNGSLDNTDDNVNDLKNAINSTRVSTSNEFNLICKELYAPNIDFTDVTWVRVYNGFNNMYGFRFYTASNQVVALVNFSSFDWLSNHVVYNERQQSALLGDLSLIGDTYKDYRNLTINDVTQVIYDSPAISTTYAVREKYRYWKAKFFSESANVINETEITGTTTTSKKIDADGTEKTDSEYSIIEFNVSEGKIYKITNLGAGTIYKDITTAEVIANDTTVSRYYASDPNRHTLYISDVTGTAKVCYHNNATPVITECDRYDFDGAITKTRYGLAPENIPTAGQVLYNADTMAESGHIVNAIAYKDGVIIAARSNGKVVRIGYDGTETELLSITGYSFDWRLCWMDSNETVFVSPHATRGAMTMTERGLYRLAKGESSFTKVISLYDPTSSIVTETEENNDTIWTMCEDNAGNLYAGVYAHTTHDNPAIYKSTDGGVTWSYLINFKTAGLTPVGKHIHSVIYSPWQKALYCTVGEINKIWKSVNGGATWTDIGVTLPYDKGSAMLALPYGILIGSDGAYNCALNLLYPDDKTYKTVYVGWANTVFAIRRSDETGFIYAFCKIDSSALYQKYYPPYSVLSLSGAEQEAAIQAWRTSDANPLYSKWLEYHESVKDIFPDDAIIPTHYAILVSRDGGKSFEILKKFNSPTSGPDGFWTTGFAMNGEILTGHYVSTQGYVYPIVISEGKHKYVSDGCDFSGEIFIRTNSSASASQFADNASLDTLITLINAIPTDTASGSIASFTDGADDVSVKDLTVTLPYLSDGYTGVTVKRTGKNLFGGSALKAKILEIGGNDNGDNVSIGSGTLAGKILFNHFKANTQYTVILDCAKASGNTNSNIYVYYTNDSFDRIYLSGDVTERQTVVFTSTSGKTIDRIQGSNGSVGIILYYATCGVFEGTVSASDFEAYTGQEYTVSWADTVYGGSLDLTTGGLTSAYASDGTELAEAVTYQLTPQEVKTLLGKNNIYADTGDVSVEYRADIKKYIDKVVATAVSALS